MRVNYKLMPLFSWVLLVGQTALSDTVVNNCGCQIDVAQGWYRESPTDLGRDPAPDHIGSSGWVSLDDGASFKAEGDYIFARYKTKNGFRTVPIRRQNPARTPAFPVKDGDFKSQAFEVHGPFDNNAREKFRAAGYDTVEMWPIASLLPKAGSSDTKTIKCAGIPPGAINEWQVVGFTNLCRDTTVQYRIRENGGPPSDYVAIKPGERRPWPLFKRTNARVQIEFDESTAQGFQRKLSRLDAFHIELPATNEHKTPTWNDARQYAFTLAGNMVRIGDVPADGGSGGGPPSGSSPAPSVPQTFNVSAQGRWVAPDRMRVVRVTGKWTVDSNRPMVDPLNGDTDPALNTNFGGYKLSQDFSFGVALVTRNGGNYSRLERGNVLERGDIVQINDKELGDNAGEIKIECEK